MDDEEQHQLQHLDIENLKVLSVLGRGAKGVVFLVRKGLGSTDGELLALKVVSKAFLIQKKNNKADKNDGHGDINGSEYKRICFERDVLRQFQHPLLPKLRGVFDTNSVVGYAIDYCPGRNLNSLRKKQTEHMFSNDIIRFYTAELVLALEYLHGLGIVYRDLKPENIMIQENGHLMLVDFDLSTKLSPKSLETTPILLHGSAAVAKVERVKRNRLTSFFKCGNSDILPDDSSSLAGSVRTESDSVCKSNSFVGTEEYVAPEIILDSGHDFAVDWWSLGVLLYEMLYGVTPFRGENRKETFYRILAKTPELVGETTPLRDLIAKLLEKDPKQRISVEGIKGHDFFRGIEWDSVVRISRPPYIPSVLTVENEEDEEVNVELFVHGIFGQSEANNTNANKNTTSSINTHDTVNKGVWVEGLNNISENDNFWVF